MSKSKSVKTTLIRGIDVPVAAGITSVNFSCGENGVEEAGEYHFYCAFGTDQFGDWTINGRALASLPVGDRFTRMEFERLVSDRPGDKHNSLEDRAVYEALWRRLPTIKGIRPSSYREVAGWMAGHKPDSIYAQPNWICQGRSIEGLPPKEIV
jgi:hypothetical protein